MTQVESAKGREAAERDRAPDADVGAEQQQIGQAVELRRGVGGALEQDLAEREHEREPAQLNGLKSIHGVRVGWSVRATQESGVTGTLTSPPTASVGRQSKTTSVCWNWVTFDRRGTRLT